MLNIDICTMHINEYKNNNINLGISWICLRFFGVTDDVV